MSSVASMFRGKPIRGLTLWRPWPWAFTHADKRVENRTWSPPETMIGSWIALHAGQRFDSDAAEDMEMGLYSPFALLCPTDKAAHPSGVIVAVMRLESVLWQGPSYSREPPSPWHAGPYCWQFYSRGIHVLPEPVPCRGAQGLWLVPDDTLHAIQKHWPGRPPLVDDFGEMRGEAFERMMNQ